MSTINYMSSGFFVPKAMPRKSATVDFGSNATTEVTALTEETKKLLGEIADKGDAKAATLYSKKQDGQQATVISPMIQSAILSEGVVIFELRDSKNNKAYSFLPLRENMAFIFDGQQTQYISDDDFEIEWRHQRPRWDNNVGAFLKNTNRELDQSVNSVTFRLSGLPGGVLHHNEKPKAPLKEEVEFLNSDFMHQKLEALGKK